MRQYGWRRPRKRLYPKKPRQGVRAAEPDQLWHVDVTILRLTDRTRVYIHAIIDNASRRILASAVESHLSGATTKMLFEKARAAMPGRDGKPIVMTDGGSENLVLAEDAIGKVATRLIAQVDVAFSNSMVEAFWRQLKHQWLYLHALDTLAGVRRLVEQYVADHNGLIPRPELGGRTPDEVYFGACESLHDDLIRERAEAHLRRVEVNRATSCGVCEHERSSTSVEVVP